MRVAFSLQLHELVPIGELCWWQACGVTTAEMEEVSFAMLKFVVRHSPSSSSAPETV